MCVLVVFIFCNYWDYDCLAKGHLVIFDSKPNQTWDEKIFQKQEAVGKYMISVCGL